MVGIPDIFKFKFMPLPTRQLTYVWKGAMAHMGVSKNSGTPKWVVYNGKPY